MVTYKNEIRRVIKSVSADVVGYAKSIDLDVIFEDWEHFFSINDLKPEDVYKAYEEVVRYKAETNSTFGHVSKVDILAAAGRLRKRKSAKKASSKPACEICGGKGLVSTYNPTTGTDELTPCGAKGCKVAN